MNPAATTEPDDSHSGSRRQRHRHPERRKADGRLPIHVILSTTTPRGGANLWNDMGCRRTCHSERASPTSESKNPLRVGIPFQPRSPFRAPENPSTRSSDSLAQDDILGASSDSFAPNDKPSSAPCGRDARTTICPRSFSTLPPPIVVRASRLHYNAPVRCCGEASPLHYKIRCDVVVRASRPQDACTGNSPSRSAVIGSI